MRIAFVIINANQREGTARAVVEVAQRLATRHDVHLVSRTVEDVDASRITLHRVPGVRWPEVADFSSFVLLAPAVIGRIGADIIHCAGCNVPDADVYAIQTVQREKIRVMEELQAHRNAALPRRITRQAYDWTVMWAERKSYRASGPRGRRLFLPVSEGTRHELLNHYELSGANVEVIPNGVDLNVFNPRLRATERPAVRQEIGLTDDDLAIVFSGGDWRRKGLDVALQALSRVADSNVKLLVAGDDPLRQEFRALANQLGIEKRVVWLGFRRDLHRIYAASDLFIFPTRYEAFSLATIEAAAAGLPVLMSQVSGSAELLGDGSNGRILPRDPEAFAAALNEYIASPSLRRMQGEASRSVAEAKFGWARIADLSEQAYVRLLDCRAEELRSRQGASAASPAVGAGSIA
jgi:glycosyltransferase involved in cell wall biosynthesis